MKLTVRSLITYRICFVLMLASIGSTRSTALNYYWIGGSGNWSDLSHWATTSGGTVLQTQIPTALDDVYFDGNSFSAAGQTVNFDALTVLVRSVNWTGVTNNPQMSLPYGRLMKIYGSLTLVPGMQTNIFGDISFEATTAGHTIRMGNQLLPKAVVFNGVGGSWTLMDAFTSNNRVSLNAGTLNTNGQAFRANQFWSSSTATRTLTLGNSVFTLDGSSMAFWIENTGCTVNAGTSTINFVTDDAELRTITPTANTFYNVNFTAPHAGYLVGSNNFHDVDFAGTGNVVNACTFHNLSFHKHGNLQASNSFNDLSFTAGYTYTLWQVSTQTINGTFTANGNCSALIAINSESAGVPAFIVHPSGPVSISYAILRDIHGNGATGFSAINSTDLGNNTGWTFTTVGIQNLYWIGNSGNWNDGTHWSLSSGGPPSGCAPTPLDNVFFDAASFTQAGQSVVINVPTAYCRDMDWTGALFNPQLDDTSADNYLKVFGSLKFIPQMNMHHIGKTSFEGNTTGKTITSAGKKFLNEVFLGYPGGEWTLLDAFRSDTSLAFRAGTFNTNGQTLTLSNFLSLDPYDRTLNMSNSVFNLTGIEAWNAQNGQITLNCGTSVINCSNATGVQFFGNTSIPLTFYDLNFTSPAPTNSVLRYESNFHNVKFFGDGIIAEANHFNNVTFVGNGEFVGSSDFHDLNLTAGRTYRFWQHHTQTLSGALNATGTCNALLTMSCNIPDSTAYISHPPGAVNVSNVVMKDVHGIGGAVFTATNSNDLGNNTGWNFVVSGSQNLYWIGNSGNWEDGNHWSLTSGGPASGCSPTPLTNVFFDANSFSLPGQNVALNITTAYCRDMNWTGVTNKPKFGVNSGTQFLKLYGSLTLVDPLQMSLFFGGQWHFEATDIGHTIDQAGHSFTNNAEFNGNGGGWTLLNNFAADIIWFNKGTLNTNNDTVSTKNFWSITNNTRVLNMGSSIFNTGESPAFWIENQGITVNAGTSKINCGGTMVSFIDEGPNHDTYYDLEFTGLAGTTGLILGSCDFHDVTFTGNASINFPCNFHDVAIANNGQFIDNNSYHNLSLSAGFAYTFWHGRTQTINGNLTASGTCSANITFSSDIPDSTTTINHPNGAVVVDYAIMRDVHGIGGTGYTANLSLDQGNNNGWTFNSSGNPDLYWIGNSGEWADPTHWSFTSGGPPAGCIPSAITNVFFDANSFPNPTSICTIIGSASCRNMDWTGVTNSSSLASGPAATELKIYGSLKLVPFMNYDFTAQTKFVATTPGQTIECAGRRFWRITEFNGIGGAWKMIDNFTTDTLNLIAGTLNSNDQTVTAGSFWSMSDKTRRLEMGSSVFDLSVDSAWLVSNSGFTLDAGTSVINLLHANGYLRDNNSVPDTYYDVNFIGNDESHILGSNIFHNVNFAGNGYIHAPNSFNDVVFQRDGQIRSSNNFHDLFFSAEHTYTPWQGTTQTIIGRWMVQGSCTEYIVLLTDQAGSFATFNVAADSVFGHNIHIRDIHCTGSAIFMAYNSVDLGGNAGWLFTTLPPLGNAGPISGPTSFCGGATGINYQVSPVQGSIYYTWTVPPGATIVSGQGTTSVIVDFGSASSGNISVITNNGCNVGVNSDLGITFNTPATPDVSISTSPGNVICPGGNVTFTATANNTGGGTVSYDFLLNGSSVQNGNAATYSNNSLADGDIISCVITITGGQCITGNTASSAPITMTVDPSAGTVNANAGNDVSISAGQTTQLNGTGDPGTYLWTPATGLSAVDIHNPTASPSVTTSYTFTITDALGCVGSDVVVVTVLSDPDPDCLIEPMAAITPNGDGIHEKWIVKRGSCNGVVSVNVFNRYGAFVYRNQHYNDDWQGTYKGQPLPDGTYYYYIEYTDSNGQRTKLRGNLTILR